MITILFIISFFVSVHFVKKLKIFDLDTLVVVVCFWVSLAGVVLSIFYHLAYGVMS